MSQQKELPGASEQWKSAHADATLSGGRIVNFTDGWAVFIFCGGRSAHFYKRAAQSRSVIADQLDEARSLCGHVAPVRGLFGQGNYPRCGKCQQKLQKGQG